MDIVFCESISFDICPYDSENDFDEDGICGDVDECPYDFDRLRLKKGSGDGGHNGIKSINYIINATDYFRLRIGVGRPPSGIDPAEYVLSRFLSDEIEEIKFLVEDAIDIVKVFSKDKEMAIKQASERRIIDVV